MRMLPRVVCAAALSALAILSTAGAGVNTPQSGWHSGNPLLGPSTLMDVTCSGATCYAAGHFGTLLKTKDGGRTWSGIVTGLTLDLLKVRLAGGSADRVLAGGGCTVRRSDDGGDTFFRLPFTARETSCSSPVAGFSFPTDKDGYVLLQDGRFLATADGGHTFSRRTAPPNTAPATDVLCTAVRTCFVTGSTGQIQRTNDGGVSWTSVYSGGLALTGLEAVNPTLMFAVGMNMTILKSTDGGATWSRRPFQGQNLRTIRCSPLAECLITTEAGDRVLKTLDGGDMYTAVVPSNDQTYAVGITGPNSALVAGAFGSVEVSNDLGETWSAVGTRIRGSFAILSAVTGDVAYAGGANGVLARTTDGGETWANVSPPTDAAILGLSGAGLDRLYVLAADGTVQRSDNGGASYRLLGPPAGRFLDIQAVGADGLLLVGRDVARSTNGGESFDVVRASAVRGTRVADLAGPAVVAYGARVAAVSTDVGATWRKLPLPKKRVVRDLDFVTARLGYVLDSGGGLWKTADGGRRWVSLPTLGTAGAYELEFADARNGYVAVRSFGSVGNRGLVLRTSDAGKSWHPQIVSRDLIAGLASGGATDYALAGESSLYATPTRGDTGAPQALTLRARPTVLKKPGVAVVSGKLTPADGGEEIVVARLSAGRWTIQRAVAASNGAFTTRWRLTRDSVFVAQVLGDADHAGAGTPALTVRVRPARKRS